MEWFDSSVDEALNDYQKKQGILVVYVYSENDQNSQKFEELWKSIDLTLFANIPYVAIRLLKDSEGAQQFAQFFPTLTIPVCYILGLNAQPLEVITALQELTPDTFKSSFVKAISLYKEQMKEQGIPLPVGIEKEAAKKPDDMDVDKEDNVAVNQEENPSEMGLTKSDEAANAAATEGMSKEEKLEYYRKLLEAKKITDAQKEEEERKEKERQRRNDGKAMAEARERHRDKELREAAEERRRQKEEDAQALKRIRDQLKADKEERAKRNRGETTGGPSDQEAQQKEASSQQQQPQINKPISTDECRIQCKFPDGSSLQMVLPSKEPLQMVWDAVSKDSRKPSSFFLVQPYPRRKLTELDKSLLDYGLTPSSAILVIAADKQSSPNSSSLVANGYMNMLLGIIYIPYSFAYQFLASFATILGLRRTDQTQSGEEGQQQQRKTPKSDKKENDNKTIDSAGTSRDGNIRRFRNDDNDNSDNEATWNGNSTQQL